MLLWTLVAGYSDFDFLPGPAPHGFQSALLPILADWRAPSDTHSMQTATIKKDERDALLTESNSKYLFTPVTSPHPVALEEKVLCAICVHFSPLSAAIFLYQKRCWFSAAVHFRYLSAREIKDAYLWTRRLDLPSLTGRIRVFPSHSIRA